MVRFLDRFYRDRLLLLAMIALALVLSLGLAVAQPRAYESTARVWVDTSIQGDHPDAYITAADAGGRILGELLKTRDFCGKVLSRSRFVTTPGRPSGAAACDDIAYLALSTGVVIGAAGPNVVTVSFRHRSPRMAASTTQAVIDLFKQEVLTGQAQRAQATVGFYEKQVSTARAALSRADARISDYLGTSADPTAGSLGAAAPDPGAAQGATPPDVGLLALQRDDDTLRKQTDDLSQKLNQARLDLTVIQQSTPYGFRVVDPPLAADRPVSRTKPLLMAGVGGLFAGLLLSALILTILTAADTSLRYPNEVEPVLGLRLAGTVPHIAGAWPR
jgi:uncharacterized protein involved in exopolysaccharide biosynthesis